MQTNHIANITIDGTADLDKMGTKDVNITGGILTSGTRTVDDAGKVTFNDAGTLNYGGKLTTQDLKDHSDTEQRGMNLNVSVSTTKDKADKTVVGGSTSIGVTHTGRETESTVKATLGKGSVAQAENMTINRNVNDTIEVTRDQITGALNSNITVDNRLFSKKGREQMADEQKELFPNLLAAGQMTVTPFMSGTAAIIGLASGDQTLAQAFDTLMQPANAARFVQEHPDQAAVIAAFEAGDYEGLPQTQAGLQTLARYLNVDVNVLLTTVTNAIGLKGATDGTIAAIDVTANNRGDVVQTLGHEAAHDLGLKSEFAADLSGWATSFGFDVGVQASHTVIDGYRLQLGTGSDAVTQAVNAALLQQNNEQLVDAIVNHPQDFDYKNAAKFTGPNSEFKNGLIRSLGGALGVGASLGSLADIVKPEFREGMKVLLESDDPALLLKIGILSTIEERQRDYAMFDELGDEFGRGMVIGRNAADIAQVAEGIIAIPKVAVAAAKLLKATGKATINGTTFLYQAGNIFVLNTNKAGIGELAVAGVGGNQLLKDIPLIPVKITDFPQVAEGGKISGNVDQLAQPKALIESKSNVTAGSGSAVFKTSGTIIRDTTVELNQAIRLSDGRVLPEGTIVTTNGNALSAVLPDGTKIRGNVDKLVQSQPQIGYTSNITSDIAPTTKGLMQYGPMSEKGPLPQKVANTFRSATYAETITTEPTILYRVYGNSSEPLGKYWTTTPPTGPTQSIIDSALKPKWGNTATKVIKIEVPSGVKFYQGQAAQQGGLVGGGSQVLFPSNIEI